MLINLSHVGLLQVSGEGAMKLLQGQLTCNIAEVTAEQSRLGAHCNPQGRILSFFRIFYFREAYYLQMPKEILPEAMAALQKYAMFFKVALTDVSETIGRVSYEGDALKNHIAKLPEQTDEAVTLNDLLIIKLAGPAQYEIIGTPDALKKITDLLATDTHPDSINLWKSMQIAAGIPSIYAATIGKLLPHEINLQNINAVSFDKGCYTGQEIIARMHYRGQLKKRMYRARVKTDMAPMPGSDIYAETPCGIIVDSCQEEDTTYHHILVIANQADTESKQLFLDPGKIHCLEFLSLPY
jgi:folate-binding protein YgfZ